MKSIDRHNYAKDILNNNFTKIAELIMSGDITPLDYYTRYLLANHLDKKKKTPGRPKDIYRNRLACSLYDDYQSFRKYGHTSHEHSVFLACTILGVENTEGNCKKSKLKKMKRTETIQKLKKIYFSQNRTMDQKGIEDLITLGGKIRRGEILIAREPTGILPPTLDPFK